MSSENPSRQKFRRRPSKLNSFSAFETKRIKSVGLETYPYIYL